MSRKRNVTTALVLTTASAAAAWVIRRRQESRRPHVGLYFEDGSMVVLPEQSPQAGELITAGAQAISLVRGS